MDSLKDIQLRKAQENHKFLHFSRPIGRFFDKKAKRVSFNRTGMCPDYLILEDGLHVEVYFKEEPLITHKERRWMEALDRMGIKYIIVSNEAPLSEQLDKLKP